MSRQRGLDDISEQERTEIREAYDKEMEVVKNSLESDDERSKRIKEGVARVFNVTLDAVTKILT